VISSWPRRIALAVVGLALLVAPAAAQTARPPARVDQAGLRALLVAVGYQPREARNEGAIEYEIVLHPPDGRAITTRVALSKDASLVWLVAWLQKVPPGRVINGNAVLDMLVQNDTLGPMHFSYNEGRRWFFLNKPVVNLDLTPEKLRGEIDHLVATIVRTEPIWDVDRWR
jgi:hypothetical protein